MSRDQKLATQTRLGSAVNTGALAGLRTIFAEDVLDHDPADQGSGPQQLVDFFPSLRAGFLDVRIEVDRVVADEDTAGKFVEQSGRTDELGMVAQRDAS